MPTLHPRSAKYGRWNNCLLADRTRAFGYLWVVAPVLPGSPGFEARELLARRARGDLSAEARIAALKLVTPHYQHVEGKSFADPLTASVVACLLEADPSLETSRVR